MRESAGAEQNINMYSKLDRRVDKSYDSRCYSFFVWKNMRNSCKNLFYEGKNTRYVTYSPLAYE